MFVKINNRVINTDKITVAEYTPPTVGQSSTDVLQLHFGEGINASENLFAQKEAVALWRFLCDMAEEDITVP